MTETEYLMKNCGARGGCYPSRPLAEADNSLRDLHNSSYDTKAEFNNCFIIHSKQDATERTLRRRSCGTN